MKPKANYQIEEIGKSGPIITRYKTAGRASKYFNEAVDRAKISWACGAKYYSAVKFFRNGVKQMEWRQNEFTWTREGFCPFCGSVIGTVFVMHTCVK